MRIVQTIAALAVAARLALPASAQDKPKTGEAPKAPSQDEMMKKWQAYASPGEAHRKLDALAGTWNVKMRSWMAPGATPEETAGTAENKWVLGNRYLAQQYDGKMMNQPFSGFGYTGFDNFKKKYESIWIDNMGTGIMISTGAMDRCGDTMILTARMDDPLTGAKTRVKEAITFVDANTHRMEMWMTGPDGKFFKTLEGTYTRKK